MYVLIVNKMNFFDYFSDSLVLRCIVVGLI